MYNKETYLYNNEYLSPLLASLFRLGPLPPPFTSPEATLNVVRRGNKWPPADRSRRVRAPRRWSATGAFIDNVPETHARNKHFAPARFASREQKLYTRVNTHTHANLSSVTCIYIHVYILYTYVYMLYNICTKALCSYNVYNMYHVRHVMCI